MAKGEPYSRVKQKARYMADQITDRIEMYGNVEGALDAYRQTVARLIESAPQQTLDALCMVLDPDIAGGEMIINPGREGGKDDEEQKDDSIIGD